MSIHSPRFVISTSYAFALLALASCKDPSGSTPVPVDDPGPEEICASSDNWLPQTAPMQLYLPQPHPDSECPFYRGAWQNFLIAMQPDASGKPAILSYPTIENVFQPKVPHTTVRSFLGDIKQAGGRQIAIDQNGNTLFYGIHVNQEFSNFIQDNQLQTAAQIQAYPNDPVKKTLMFPAGVVEFKSAWQVVEGDAAAVAAQTEKFISIETTVPTLSQDPVTKVITEDKTKPRNVTARLLAIHVVFTLPGHPEFVWGSFEHTEGPPDIRSTDSNRDVAPTNGGANPTKMDGDNAMVSSVVSKEDKILYKGGTPANLADHPITETALNLDAASQKFPGQSTSIYRMFAAAKSNTTDPDPAITSLNHNVEALFAKVAGQLDKNDKRGFYRLLGAQWMDKPRFFAVNIPIQNDDTSPFLGPHTEFDKSGKPFIAPGVSKDDLTNAIVAEGSDSALSILAGEDRMSSTAMESFTQGANAFNNCFTCHNTQAIVANGIPLEKDALGFKLLDPGLLNVSHVISQFLLEEHEASLAAPAGP